MPEEREIWDIRNAKCGVGNGEEDVGFWMLDFHRVKEFGITDWRSAEFFTMGVVSFAKGWRPVGPTDFCQMKDAGNPCRE